MMCMFQSPDSKTLQVALRMYAKTHKRTHACTPNTHLSSLRCNLAQSIQKGRAWPTEAFFQNSTMYPSIGRVGLPLQEVTMLSVFTQKVTLCLIMLIFHLKHFILQNKSSNGLSGRQLQMAKRRWINSCKRELELFQKACI